MRAMGWFIAALLILFAGGVLISKSMGWEGGWSDTRGANAMWLAVIAAMMSAGIVTASRQRALTTVFSLLAWAGAFLILILAYSYKDEFKMLWSRIEGEVSPGTAMTNGGSEVELRRGADSHFHADAIVDAATVSFMIDTGATGIALTLVDAKAAGIDVDALSFTTEINTASGVTKVALARIRQLSIGPIERTNLAVVVLPEGADASLLGLSFLDTLSSYEIRGDRLILRD